MFKTNWLWLYSFSTKKKEKNKNEGIGKVWERGRMTDAYLVNQLSELGKVHTLVHMLSKDRLP